jgi:hypothetical protein
MPELITFDPVKSRKITLLQEVINGSAYASVAAKLGWQTVCFNGKGRTVNFFIKTTFRVWQEGQLLDNIFG